MQLQGGVAKVTAKQQELEGKEESLRASEAEGRCSDSALQD